MAKCLLENGADPLIVVEGEKLYHYVLSCSQEDLGDLADYRGRFLDLIEEYVKEDPLQILFDELSQHGLSWNALDNYDCLRQVMSYEMLRIVMSCLAATLTSSGNHIITFGQSPNS